MDMIHLREGCTGAVKYFGHDFIPPAWHRSMQFAINCLTKKRKST